MGKGGFYGAIITRAPGEGIWPTPSMEVGTWSSQLWSWRVRVGPSSAYQQPAWVASLEVIARVGYLQARIRIVGLKWGFTDASLCSFMQIDSILVEAICVCYMEPPL